MAGTEYLLRGRLLIWIQSSIALDLPHGAFIIERPDTLIELLCHTGCCSFRGPSVLFGLEIVLHASMWSLLRPNSDTCGHTQESLRL
jgi:hypothetical protein